MRRLQTVALPYSFYTLSFVPAALTEKIIGEKNAGCTRLMKMNGAIIHAIYYVIPEFSNFGGKSILKKKYRRSKVELFETKNAFNTFWGIGPPFFFSCGFSTGFFKLAIFSPNYGS